MCEKPKSHVGKIVLSQRGRDSGRHYVVLAADVKQTARASVYIADGKLHKINKPKLKNLKHLRVAGEVTPEAAETIGRGRMTNRVLREILKPYECITADNEN